MTAVVEDATSHLAEADRRAIALYPRSLAPVHNKLEDKGGSDS